MYNTSIMSQKEIEKNLNYGDCNNLFYFFSDVLAGVSEKVEKTLDKIIKK